MPITTFLEAHKIRRVESLQQPWRGKFQKQQQLMDCKVGKPIQNSERLQKGWNAT